MIRTCAALSVGALCACVAPPPVVYQAPPPQQQAPFVAIPGPGKTEALFRQDDAFCRTPQALTPRPVRSGTQAGVPPAGVQPGVPPDDASRLTPGVVYLQCMEVRNNTIEPLQASAPAVYGYLQPYPVYVGPWYGYGYPWYYGSVGFGFGYGFGGYGYGYGGYGRYGGFRGGYGGYGGGFRGGYGGGGYGGGGGFRGGGGGGFGGRR